MLDPEGYQLCQINWVAHVVSQGKFCIKVPDSLCGWGAQWEGDTYYSGGIWWIGPTCQDPNLLDPPEDPPPPEEDADLGDPPYCPIDSTEE